MVFYVPHPTDRIAHTMAFVTPVVEQWLERVIVKEASKSKWHVLTLSNQVMLYKVIAKNDERVIKNNKW